MTSAHFVGEVDARWLRHTGPDRKMKLLAEFTFVDTSGQMWLAPRGSVIDGTSIPEFLWSELVGTPFVGDFRRASVVHDVACDEKKQPYKKVHRMLYDAMICDGVPEARAKMMYTAVMLFGPKWNKKGAKIKTATALSIEQLQKVLEAVFVE